MLKYSSFFQFGIKIQNACETIDKFNMKKIHFCTGQRALSIKVVFQYIFVSKSCHFREDVEAGDRLRLLFQHFQIGGTVRDSSCHNTGHRR